MSKWKKPVKRLYTLEAEDDLYIRMHQARTGGTWQDFVHFAVQAEIVKQKAIEEFRKNRKNKNV